MVSASMPVQHAKWLQHAGRPAVAGADRLAERPADLDLLAQRPQRVQPPGPGPHRRRALQAGTEVVADLPAAGRQLPAVGRRPLPPQPRLRQPHRHRQAAAAAVARHRRRPHEHCARGASVWEWAGTEATAGSEPDVVLAAAGDVPTQEILAAAWLLREHAPDLRVRVVNVVDLMALFPPERPSRTAFDATQLRRPVHRATRDVVFAFHGYPRADPPAAPRAARPRPLPRARLQRAGHDDDAVRHGRAQPDEPLPPGARGAAPRAERDRRVRADWPTLPATLDRHARYTSSSTSRTCPRCATGRGREAGDRAVHREGQRRRSAVPACSSSPSDSLCWVSTIVWAMLRTTSSVACWAPYSIIGQATLVVTQHQLEEQHVEFAGRVPRAARRAPRRTPCPASCSPRPPCAHRRPDPWPCPSTARLHPRHVVADREQRADPT